MEAARAAFAALSVEQRDAFFRPLAERLAERLVLQEKKLGQFKGAFGAHLNPSESRSSTTAIRTLVPSEDVVKAMRGFTVAGEHDRFCASVWERVLALKLHERVPTRGEDEEEVVQPFINEIYNAIFACAHEAGIPCNKLFHEYGTTSGSGGDRPDWVIVQPTEQRLCPQNTCLFIEAKQVQSMRQRKGKAETDKSTDVLMREGVAQLMERIASRREETKSPHGLGVVVNGPSIKILRIDFEDDGTDVVFPAYVTRLMPLIDVVGGAASGGAASSGAASGGAASGGEAAACPLGLRCLIALLLEQLVELFGLQEQGGFPLGPDSGLHYKGMLGAGGFCCVAEFADYDDTETFAVKFARHAADKELKREQEVLEALCAAAVPRVPLLVKALRGADGRVGLQLAPVGIPLLVHLATASMDKSDRWTFAVQVATQLAETLRLAHKAGVIHGDVRPSNVVLVRGVAYLVDWGLGSASAAHTRRDRTHLFGVPAYMADDLVRLYDSPPSTKWTLEPQHDMRALLYTCAAIAEYAAPGAVSPWGTGFIGPEATVAFIENRRIWLSTFMLPRKPGLPPAVQDALTDALGPDGPAAA